MTSLAPDVATLRIDGPETTIVFAWRDGVPWMVHHGTILPADTDLAMLAAADARPLPNSTLDIHEPANLHPEAGRGFAGYPALRGKRADMSGWEGRFAMADHEIMPGGVLFRLTDEDRGLGLEIECLIDPGSDVATFVCRLANHGDTNFDVDWLAAPVIAAPRHMSQHIGFHGSWCGEFETARADIPRGLTMRENRSGRTSHQSFPGTVLLAANTGEDMGECLGVHLGWSGNHRLALERLATGDQLVQMGALLLAGEGMLPAGGVMQTPPLYVAHSTRGMNLMSQKLHAHLRTRILRFPDPQKPRPVTVNTWEAIYFNHSPDKLVEISDAAAAVGAERFVIDDGWFAGRNDDTTSLGDWFADTAKYPQGLQPIAEHVRSKGMEFGLWVEPEMVNEKSRLFAEHPDWVLKLGSYPVLTGRNQLVLDIARQDVADYLHERLAALVGDHDIAYLKWDMNRDYHLPGDRLGHPAAYRQVEALYSLLDRLHRQFPKLEIESCSSGGARADYGILRHTQRIWPSDSNDPVERMRIQTGFSYFFPPEIMGSHVGAEWSHTSGRGMRIGMSLLAACYGHMGIEADLTSMTETELDRIRNAVASHKADRHIWHCGRFFRIRTVDPNLIGAMGVDPERNSARLVLAQLDRPRSTTPPRIVVPGLDPDRIYRVRLGFATEMVARSVRRFDNPLAAEGYNASGAVLGTVGIGVPVMLAQSGLTIAIEETSEDDQ